MSKVLAYLGLGTNLGDRWANLRNALRMLSEAQGVQVRRCSRVYETEPWGVTEQPKFLNCVVEAAVSLGPEPLLDRCKEVEREIGRLPGPRWGPRLIDLDILLYGTQVIELPNLEIPHPRLHLRAFALVPLAELNRQVLHPVLRQSAEDLAHTVEGRVGVKSVGEIELALKYGDC